MSSATDNAAKPNERKAKVFISYSRKDMGFADRLEAALKLHGFEVLIDRAEIYAFEDWWKRIQAVIARADAVVFVISPDAVASRVCKDEVDRHDETGLAGEIETMEIVSLGLEDHLVKTVLLIVAFVAGTLAFKQVWVERRSPREKWMYAALAVACWITMVIVSYKF